MSGPKHLWSGDWRNESAAASQELIRAPVKPRDATGPSPEPTPPNRAPGRSSRRRALPIALAAVLILAGAAWGLTALLGSSGPRAATTAARPSVPRSATVPTAPTGPTGPPTATAPPVAAAPTTAPIAARPVTWLGMEIETVAPGAAVIDTVAPGSQGAQAGLEPADVILEINHRPINGTGDITAAIRGLHSGDVVEIQISHGSALYQTHVTLAAPPSAYP